MGYLKMSFLELFKKCLKAKIIQTVNSVQKMKGDIYILSVKKGFTSFIFEGI